MDKEIPGVYDLTLCDDCGFLHDRDNVPYDCVMGIKPEERDVEEEKWEDRWHGRRY